MPARLPGKRIDPITLCVIILWSIRFLRCESRMVTAGLPTIFPRIDITGALEMAAFFLVLAQW